MGSQNSKFLSQQELPHQYRPIKQLPGVYQSVLNGSRLLKHKIQLNSQAEINYEKDIFIFRRMHSDRIITAYFFQKFTPSHFCNMSYQVCFFTDCPNYTMSYNLGFSFQLGLQLLIECLKGFQILFNKFGLFTIDFNNIFFDSFSQPKVWISSNLGKNRVQKHLKLSMTEQKMIFDLFRIFDSSKEERNSNQSYTSILKRQKQQQIITFKSTIIYLIDKTSNFLLARNKSLSHCFSYLDTSKMGKNPNLQAQKCLQYPQTYLFEQRDKKQLHRQQSIRKPSKMKYNLSNYNNSGNAKLSQQTNSVKNKSKNQSKNQNSKNMNRINTSQDNFSRQNNNNMVILPINKIKTSQQQFQNYVFPNSSPIHYNKENELNKQMFLKATATSSSTGFGLSPQYKQFATNFNYVHPQIKQRKWKRYNSQQDCKNKQVPQSYLSRQTNQPNNPIFHYGPSQYNSISNLNSYYQHPCMNNPVFCQKPLNSDLRFLHYEPTTINHNHNNIRIFRKSLQQFPRSYYNLSQLNDLEKQKNNVNSKLNKDKKIQRNEKTKYLNRIIQTQLNNVAENEEYTERNIYNNINDERKTCKDTKKLKEKKIHFNEDPKNNERNQTDKKLPASNTTVRNQKFKTLQNSLVNIVGRADKQKSFVSPKNTNQSHMILSNLQTLKSIINSQYSDIDQQIKRDLKNMEL